jgi:predicted dehydrogenase
VIQGGEGMYNIAFIGGGVNSAIGRSHYIAAQMDGKFKLVAGAFSRHAEINQETGESFGVLSEHVYDDYKMMLEREKDAVDVIAVLTPTDTHEQIVCDCLQAGYPVICEKSLSTSLQSALQVQKVLDEMRGFLCVTYNYTGYPMVRVLREKIQAKELGKITNIIIEMPQEGFSRYTLEHTEPKPQEWRMKDYQIPTISLDLGTHLHNMIAFLTGEHPIEVVGREDSFGFFPQIVDDVLCMANYTDDIAVQMWYSKVALGNRNGLRIRVYGTDASAEWYQAEPEILKLHDKLGNNMIIDRSNDLAVGQQDRYNRFKVGHPGGFIEAYANYYWDMAELLDCYKSGKQMNSNYLLDVNSSIEGLKLFEAVHESATTHQWITL